MIRITNDNTAIATQNLYTYNQLCVAVVKQEVNILESLISITAYRLSKWLEISACLSL